VKKWTVRNYELEKEAGKHAARRCGEVYSSELRAEAN
jgi:hypothetical protein